MGSKKLECFEIKKHFNIISVDYTQILIHLLYMYITKDKEMK